MLLRKNSIAIFRHLAALLMVCMILCTAGTLAGCSGSVGKNAGARENSGNTSELVSDAASSADKSETSDAGVMTDEEFVPDGLDELRDVSLSLVRISAGTMMGSGVLYSRDEKGLYILTAGHVLEDVKAGDAVWVTFADETSVQSTSFEIVPHGDLGLIYVADEAYADEEKYPCVLIDKECFDGLKEGSRITAAGFVSGAVYTEEEGELESAWIFSTAFDRHLLMAKVGVTDGMSGGGLFDGERHFIGIICGADDEGNAFAEPLNSILAFVVQ